MADYTKWSWISTRLLKIKILYTMKPLRIFPLIAIAMLFASCEKIMDDRNQPVPNDPKTVWLLSVEVDGLPSNVEAYSCAVFNVNNANDVNVFTRTEVKLPELLKIPGAKYLGTKNRNNDRAYAVSFFKINTQATESADLLTPLSTIIVPTCSELFKEKEETKKELPQKIGFEESGVKGYLHLRYD